MSPMSDVTPIRQTTGYAAAYSERMRKFGVLGAAVLPDALITLKLAEATLQRVESGKDADLETARTGVLTAEHLRLRAKKDADFDAGMHYFPCDDHALSATTEEPASSDVDPPSESQTPQSNDGRLLTNMQSPKSNNLPLNWGMPLFADSRPMQAQSAAAMQMGQGYKKHLDLMFQHQDRTGGGRSPAAVELLARRRRKETRKEKQAGGNWSPTDNEPPCSLNEAPDSPKSAVKIGSESSSKPTRGIEPSSIEGKAEVVRESLIKSLEEPVKNKRKAQKKTKPKTPQKEKPAVDNTETIEKDMVEETPVVGEGTVELATADLCAETFKTEDDANDSLELAPSVDPTTACSAAAEAVEDEHQPEILEMEEVEEDANDHPKDAASECTNKESEKQTDRGQKEQRAERVEQPTSAETEEQAEDEEWLTVPKLRGRKKLPKISQVAEKKVAPETSKSETKTKAKLKKDEKQVEEKFDSHSMKANEAILISTPTNVEQCRENIPSNLSVSVTPKGNRMWSDICSDDENAPEEGEAIVSGNQICMEAELAENITEIKGVQDVQNTDQKCKPDSRAKGSEAEAVHPLPQRQAKVVKAEPQPASTLTPLEREILKLEKKYREMERLRQRQTAGETLNPNQLEKLLKAEEIQDKIQELRQQKETEQLALPEPEVEHTERAESREGMSVSEPESEVGSADVMCGEYAAEMQSLGVEFIAVPHQLPDGTMQMHMPWPLESDGQAVAENGYSMIHFVPAGWETDQVAWANCAMMQQPIDETEAMQWNGRYPYGMPGMVPMMSPYVFRRYGVPVEVGFESMPLCLRGLRPGSFAGAVNAVMQVLLGVQPLMQLLVSLPPQCPKVRPTLRALCFIVDYFHYPAAPATRAPLLDATKLLRPLVEAFRRQCKGTDLNEPANFLRFLLQRLHIETCWGPEELPFWDQAFTMLSSEAMVEGSALRNIFGGTELLSWNRGDKLWSLQPFEVLQVDLPAHGIAVLKTLIGSANRGTSPNMDPQIDGLCGAPPVLIVQLQRCSMRGIRESCRVDYGLSLSVPTKDPKGAVAIVEYDLLAAVFRAPKEKGGNVYSAVRHGQDWWWFRDAVVQHIHRKDVISRQQEIRLAVYARRHCSPISVHPPHQDPLEFWMATSSEC
eukprot:gnl/MRDRNA2_/MRDRNA2_85907_c2_seq1.p1 gnl/MRDRNA2_/MRDRNA2_85907_c2~~gnl/MRDRNA2_/MRDRNA2_85907_c2_seq1.p1  ORF type:complete len:1137 (-),score=291.62 gnl/MRDRNA2_/MRDRNA2_85907_c2_seq1:702-4112(-)